MKGLLGLGGSGDAEEADWEPENPEKVKEVESKVAEVALDKGKQGVLSMPEVTSENGIGREDAAYILFRRAEKKFEVVEEDIKEIQSVLDREMKRLEQEAKKAIEKERGSGEIGKVESQAEKTFWNEEKNFEKREEKIEEDLKDIKEFTETAEVLFKISKELTESRNREKSVEHYIGSIRDIERYKIASDLEIEEEDVEELLSDLEEILDADKIQEKEPEALAKEVKKAIKQYSRDKRPIDNLDFIDAE